MDSIAVPEKALLPIESIPSPSVTVLRFLQSQNVFS